MRFIHILTILKLEVGGVEEFILELLGRRHFALKLSMATSSEDGSKTAGMRVKFSTQHRV